MSVYTKISAAEFEDLLSHYDLGTLENFEGIKAGITNTNYFLTTRTATQNLQQFVFTVFEHDALDDLDYFLKLKAYLRGQGILCPMPMADKDGNFLRLLQNKPVAIVEKLSGHTVASIDTHHCKLIGKALAQLHIAGEGFNLRHKNPRGQRWRLATFQQIESRLENSEKLLIAQQLEWLEQFDFSALPKSVIHCDLFWDNVLFYNEGKNTQLGGLIDFYYACDDICLYDVAIVANDWCTNHAGEFQTEKLTALLSAYHTVRPFTEAENQYWQHMLIMACMRFVLSRLQDKLFPLPGEMTFIKDPNEIFNILQQHLKAPLPELFTFFR